MFKATAPTQLLYPNAPYGFKKYGTPRTRRAPGTGPHFKGKTPKPLKAPVPPPPTYQCPTNCGLSFADTKDPQNSLLVHVRYKAKKGCELHQTELDKIVAARITDSEILRARKNARQRRYRKKNLEWVEYRKKLSRGREKARKILGAGDGREIKEKVEEMAEEFVEKWDMDLEAKKSRENPEIIVLID